MATRIPTISGIDICLLISFCTWYVCRSRPTNIISSGMCNTALNEKYDRFQEHQDRCEYRLRRVRWLSSVHRNCRCSPEGRRVSAVTCAEEHRHIQIYHSTTCETFARHNITHRLKPRWLVKQFRLLMTIRATLLFLFVSDPVCEHTLWMVCQLLTVYVNCSFYFNMLFLLVLHVIAFTK